MEPTDIIGDDVTLYRGDCLAVLPTLAEKSVRCCVTSPPYWGLRDYGHPDQLGLESTPEEYVAKMVAVFREVRRVLADDGTLWLNLGDSYSGSWGNYGGQNRGNGTQRSIVNGSAAPNPAYDGLESFRPPNSSIPGLKPKDLVGIPWRVAFALQADGWYLRQDIIWAKPNPMPESVTDRCTKAHEYLFLLSKSARYFYDAEAIAEEQTSSGVGGFTNKATLKAVRLDAGHAPSMVNAVNDGVRNKRSVWTITTKPFKEAHFAVMPKALVEPCIKAGSEPGDTILDPFGGSGTVAEVAIRLNRKAMLIELNPEYVGIANNRVSRVVGAGPGQLFSPDLLGEVG